MGDLAKAVAQKDRSALQNEVRKIRRAAYQLAIDKKAFNAPWVTMSAC
jgi:hypothetical protein